MIKHLVVSLIGLVLAGVMTFIMMLLACFIVAYAGETPPSLQVEVAPTGSFPVVLDSSAIQVLDYVSPNPDGSCPVDHPTQRTVQSAIPNSCTLMACKAKIYCMPDGSSCAALPSNDCNTCTYPPPYNICVAP